MEDLITSGWFQMAGWFFNCTAGTLSIITEPSAIPRSSPETECSYGLKLMILKPPWPVPLNYGWKLSSPNIAILPKVMAVRITGKFGCGIKTATQSCSPARTGRLTETGNLHENYQRSMIRVVLPFHLRNLARVNGEVQLELAAPVTIRAVVDALEARYPVLQGTIRDHGTLKRRPFVRYFACKEDVSLEPPETQLPEAVVNGVEPFLIIGAMAGG